MKKETFSVANPEDFSVVIDRLYTLPPAQGEARVVCLSGDLGAGKTTFVQQLAARLKIDEPIVSPTFVIMKSYEIEDDQQFDTLVHIEQF